MLDTPKIIKAKSHPNRNIDIQYENGFQATFNFENYYDYKGFFAFLKDIENFLKLEISSNGNYVFWMDEANEEIEIDPVILHSICSHKKVIINGKTVFDPALGKNAWL